MLKFPDLGSATDVAALTNWEDKAINPKHRTVHRSTEEVG